LRNYTFSASLTPAIVNVSKSSNIGIIGRYVFRVDASNIIQPNLPSLPGKFVINVSPLLNNIRVCTVYVYVYSQQQGKRNKNEQRYSEDTLYTQ
jgi:hypothetical protein